MAKQKAPERVYGYLQGPDGTRVAIKQRAVVAAIRGHEARVAELATEVGELTQRLEMANRLWQEAEADKAKLRARGWWARLWNRQ